MDLERAGSAALPASAIYVAIFNAAIGLGALLGSLVLNVSGLASGIPLRSDHHRFKHLRNDCLAGAQSNLDRSRVIMADPFRHG